VEIEQNLDVGLQLMLVVSLTLGTHWIGGWLDPRVLLNVMAKTEIPAPDKKPVIEPEALTPTLDKSRKAIQCISHPPARISRRHVLMLSACLHRPGAIVLLRLRNAFLYATQLSSFSFSASPWEQIVIKIAKNCIQEM